MKWSKIDEAYLQFKVYRQRKILRDAKFKFHLREIKPDIRIQPIAGKVGNYYFGC